MNRLKLHMLHDMQAEALPGGLGDYKSDDDFNPFQLQKGIEIESEHTSDPRIAKEIAKDHLIEDPTYYDKLEQMEKSKSCCNN